MSTRFDNPETPEPPRLRGPLAMLLPDAVPLDMQIVGRTLFHTALVGAAAGLVGAGFFAALEAVQRLLLVDLAGYIPLLAHGEQIMENAHPGTFRPWLLVLLPAFGALISGLLTQLAPETRGGGGDAMIDAFHHHGGMIRRRVIWVKALASIATLGSGGAGGREGPTMQIGGALGSLIGRALRVSGRERRILMVAGVAAGISAVFRTPLGAALLAIEVLYRDDFEAEALVPAVLSSVVSYSVVISIFGESTLFARAPGGYPFIPAHLPLYALMAIFVALLSAAFVELLRAVQRISKRIPVAPWLRPAVGGLALGVWGVGMILLVGDQIGRHQEGIGVLGGGYGVAQAAITGAAWLPDGWRSVEILLLLCGAKLLASSLTIGSGGSAGDFAPSMVLGALLGGAFGHAARLLLADPRIDPGAFALVGMGTFYGGIAHVPISALILVSEMAGNYDLLVPLMLSVGIAFAALRKDSLYGSQVPTRRDSPAHRVQVKAGILASVRVGDLPMMQREHVMFELGTPAVEILARVHQAGDQMVFPVLDRDRRLKGMLTLETVRFLGTLKDAESSTIAADIMQPPAIVTPESDLLVVANLMLSDGLRELPVTDAEGRMLGFIDEADIFRAYLGSASGLSGGNTPSYVSIAPVVMPPSEPGESSEHGTFTDLKIVVGKWGVAVRDRLRSGRR